MKKIVFLILALVMSAGTTFGQGGSGQGQLKRDSLKTRTFDRKQLRKRDSTGAYHEQNIKNRQDRQNQKPGSTMKGGQGKKQKGK
jgi:hypothetical protein